MNKVIKAFLIILSVIHFSAAADESLLFVTDMHFDPLADTGIVAKLIEQPVSKWNEIFQSSRKKELSGYRDDSNYPLWQSALKAMKQTVPHPATVIVGGDFFRHTFRADFEKLYKEQNPGKSDFRSVYSSFIQKTIQFLVQGLVEQFPEAQFIPVIGNNDSTCGDYMVALRDPFLKDFANAWQQASKKSIPQNQSSDFASSGHFITTLQQNPKLRIIVGNDIFMAPQYNGRCGNSFVPPGQGELSWIDQQLTAAEKADEKVWLITHIPPGVDVTRSLYKSIAGKKSAFSPMLKDDYNQRYLDVLHRHSKNILMHFTAHGHFGEIRIPGGEVAVLLAPSISPDKTNNPTFQVYDVDAKNMVLKNFTNYSLDLSAEGATAWQKILDFNQAFEQKEVSLASLKAVAAALKEGKSGAAYSQMVTSNGALAKTFFSLAQKAYVCGMTEMTLAAFQTCVGKED